MDNRHDLPGTGIAASLRSEIADRPNALTNYLPATADAAT